MGKRGREETWEEDDRKMVSDPGAEVCVAPELDAYSTGCRFFLVAQLITRMVWGCACMCELAMFEDSAIPSPRSLKLALRFS